MIIKKLCGKNKKNVLIRFLAMETTKAGLPRKRRPGAGRPTKHGEQTRSIRVPLSIPTELITNIPELQVIIDYWEKECRNNPESSRHYYLRKVLDEIRGLGY
jgi:hypothetical protein